jgi:hypothetical protein
MDRIQLQKLTGNTEYSLLPITNQTEKILTHRKHLLTYSIFTCYDDNLLTTQFPNLLMSSLPSCLKGGVLFNWFTCTSWFCSSSTVCKDESLQVAQHGKSHVIKFSVMFMLFKGLYVNIASNISKTWQRCSVWQFARSSTYISWQYDGDRFDPRHVVNARTVLVPVGGQDLVCRGGTVTSILRHDILTISLEVQPSLIKGDTVRISKAGAQTNRWDRNNV